MNFTKYSSSLSSKNIWTFCKVVKPLFIIFDPNLLFFWTLVMLNHIASAHKAKRLFYMKSSMQI